VPFHVGAEPLEHHHQSLSITHVFVIIGIGTKPAFEDGLLLLFSTEQQWQ
jgi:hypothetical protein